MANGEGKGGYWAPVNVGATKIPESVPLNRACIDITESSGKLISVGTQIWFPEYQ